MYVRMHRTTGAPVASFGCTYLIPFHVMAMKRSVISIVLLTLVVAGTYVGWRVMRAPAHAAEPSRRPPVTVSSATAKETSWPRGFDAVATLTATQHTEVAAEVPGIVNRIEFKSGQQVSKGDVLVQLDDETDRSRLRELASQLELDRLTLKRQRELADKKFISEAALDGARSALEQSSARVVQQKTLIAKKSVRAPFDGRVGIREIDLGTYLKAGAPIVELQTLDPVYADFSLPQQYIDDLKPGYTVRFTVDSFPGKTFTGRISAIAPGVKEATRNFDVRATLPNPELKLRPGMFGDIEVLQPGKRDALTVPDTAITYNPYGDSVFVIEKQGNGTSKTNLVAKRVFVQTGEHRGTLVEITKGISAGEKVVSAGQLKLHDGAPVRIDNQRALQQTLNPIIQHP